MMHNPSSGQRNQGITGASDASMHCNVFKMFGDLVKPLGTKLICESN